MTPARLQAPRARAFGFVLAAVVGAAAHAAGAPADDARARTQYLLHCGGCHGMEARGNAAIGIPRMAGQVGHFLRLPEGRAFLVQVPGMSQSGLGDADMARMLNWLVYAFSPGEVPADFEPYTAAEVARLHAVRLPDPVGTRARLVDSLRQQGYTIE